MFHFGTVLRKTAAFDIIGAIARIRFAALRHFRDIAHITVKRLFFVFLVSRQFVVPIIRFGTPDRPRMSETDRRSVAVAFPECFPPPKRRTETRRDRRARHPRFVHIKNFFRAHDIFLHALNLRAVVQKRKRGAGNRAVFHFRIGERRYVRFCVEALARVQVCGDLLACLFIARRESGVRFFKQHRRVDKRNDQATYRSVILFSPFKKPVKIIPFSK